MRLSNVRIIIAASTLAVIALVFLQVRWLVQAKNLIEAEFEQKVQMALCYAVEKSSNEKTDVLDFNPFEFNALSVCKSHQDQADSTIVEILEKEENQILQENLSSALTFYGIDMDYEMAIIDNSNNALSCNMMNSPYCCSLSPFQLGGGDKLLNVQFPNKTQYVLGRIGFMLVSSILILLFISIVFLLANYTLLRQKRISELNVDFFNNMAHEFRTPLTNISLASKLLIKNRAELKDNRYLEVVKRENQKLLQQIERLLYLGKLENGECQIKKTCFCLQELLEEVVLDMDMQIKEQEAVVEVLIEGYRGDKKNWRIEGDRLHLGNVFRNLIDNALKYSDSETHIEIRLQKRENGMVVSFKDNGIGISKGEQVYVFDKFSRIANQNVHNQKGFGLGLSYVKMIVEQHNGFVELVSDLQKGCRFDLFLPIAVNQK